MRLACIGGLRKELGLSAFRFADAPVVAQGGARSGPGVSHFSWIDAAISPLAVRKTRKVDTFKIQKWTWIPFSGRVVDWSIWFLNQIRMSMILWSSFGTRWSSSSS